MIGQNKAELGEELQRAVAEVQEQKKKCSDLQQVIRAMTDELQTVKDEIQEKIIALKKSEAQNKTLSKRDKVRACMRIVYASPSLSFHMLRKLIGLVF